MLGGHAVAQCVRNEGVRHIFCVPGESHIAVIDGLVNTPDIKLITNRQEGCAAFMAEGYAKSTRKVGVCLVTRGPGATNASIAIHSAKYDSAPLVLLVGQVGRNARGREAGQELDYGQFFGSIAKWVVEINNPTHVPRVMTRAFHIARSGRPGPVVVSLPRDMLEEKAEIPMVNPYPPAQPSPDPRLIEEMVMRIGAAKKPMLLVGSGTQYAGAWQELIDFSEKFQIPVLTSYKRQDAFPNSHANYIGNLSSANKNTRALASSDADLLVVLGCRLSQQTTGGFSFPRPGQAFIQIDTDEQNIGQNARPEVAIVADAKLALSAALKHNAPPAECRPRFLDRRTARRAKAVLHTQRETKPAGFDGAGHGRFESCAAARCDHDNRRRQFRPVATALSRIRSSEFLCFADIRLHGPRGAIGSCRQARAPRTFSRRPRRRRRLFDDRSGDGDGETIRRENHHHRL